MKKVYTYEPVRSFKIPDGIVYERVNPETGVAPENRTDPVIFECFKEGTEPKPFEPNPLESAFTGSRHIAAETSPLLQE
jgi:penicillin-binding protein 1A